MQRTFPNFCAFLKLFIGLFVCLVKCRELCIQADAGADAPNWGHHNLSWQFLEAFGRMHNSTIDPRGLKIQRDVFPKNMGRRFMMK